MFPSQVTDVTELQTSKPKLLRSKAKVRGSRDEGSNGVHVMVFHSLRQLELDAGLSDGPTHPTEVLQFEEA